MHKDRLDIFNMEFRKNAFFLSLPQQRMFTTGNTKGGSINVLFTSCLTGLDQSVLQIKTKIFSCHTSNSKPVKQEVKGTVILPPLVFPVHCYRNTIGLENEEQLCCFIHFNYLVNWINQARFTRPNQCLQIVRLVTLLCFTILLGGKSVLLTCPWVMSFLPRQSAP